MEQRQLKVGYGAVKYRRMHLPVSETGRCGADRRGQPRLRGGGGRTVGSSGCMTAGRTSDPRSTRCVHRPYLHVEATGPRRPASVLVTRVWPVT